MTFLFRSAAAWELAAVLPHADVAESIGRELLVYGRRIPKAEMFARIDAVDADTVRAVADRFIYDQDLAIAAVGDTQFLPDYNWFRRRTYWIRY
jgi:processing peptidase subunit beta